MSARRFIDWPRTAAWTIAVLLIPMAIPIPAGAGVGPDSYRGSSVSSRLQRDPIGISHGIRSTARASLRTAGVSGPRDLWLRQASSGDFAQGGGAASNGAAATLRMERTDPASRVSPALAFLMSATLPGSGQLVEGRNRAFAYLGAEALAWITHFSWKDASRKKEQESESFADRHWSFDDWSSNADTCSGSIPFGMNRADLQESILSQRAARSDAYYASLAKQDGYRGGWDDFACGTTESYTVNRRAYSGMRQDSNDFLARARLATTFAFLNRIVSAVDAYRTARGARMSLSPRTRLELDLKGSVARPGVFLRLRRGL